MSYPQKHIIQRLVLEAEINTESVELSANAWQNEVENWVYQELLPSLEVALNEAMIVSNETLRIDRLELELGVFNSELLKQKLGNKLRELKTESATDDKKREDKVEIPYLTQSQKTIEAFLYFLETGRLPWWETPLPFHAWEAKILEAFAENKASLFQFPNKEAVRKRLAGHFSEVFFNELVQKLFTQFYEKSLEFQDNLKKLLNALKLPWSKQSEWIEMVREIMLHFFGQQLPPEQLPLYVINHLPKKDFFLLKNATTALPSETWKGVWGKQMTQLLINVEEKEVNIQAGENQEKLLMNLVFEENKIRDEIYISNAGLVLLHPFIELFFEELKIAENGKLKQQQQGVSLLQYLATGQQKTPEYDLPLNKLLCGISLEVPVIGKLRLTKQEKNEAQKLLEAVVRHWTALKNTSSAGLQGNFLCREGKLTQKQDGDWLLQIERKSIDILLADLPWSISMIQLPWMPHLLWVEWE